MEENTARRFETNSGLKPLPEARERLWILILGPLIWSLHFLLSYSTAAVWCAKVAGRAGSLAGARVAIAVFTLLALGGLAAIAWRGYSKHRLGNMTAPHDFPTAVDRHRFLGFASLLLCLLSFVATLYVALAALFIENCG